jgi:parallel beta-helix repeat protein
MLLSLTKGESCATEYYVSQNGSDTNEGTADNPLLTLNKAISIAVGGDIIILKQGTYIENTVVLKGINTSNDMKLTIKAYENDEVIIDHNGEAYGWWIENQSYLVIDGITIQNAQEGIVILGGSKHVSILNSTVRDIVNRGVFSHGYQYSDYPEFVTIDNCSFSNIGQDTAGADISLGTNTTNFTISNNRLFGNVDGIVAEDSSSGHIIENNEIGNHTQEDGIDLKRTYMKTPTAQSDYVEIRNNAIYGNHLQTGITIQMGTQKIKIYNNKIYSNRWGIWINDEGTANIEISENKIYENDDTGIIVNMSVTGDINILKNVIHHNGHSSNTGVKGGIAIYEGATFKILNNVFANNVSGGQYENQVWIGSAQVSSTILDYSKYYTTENQKLIRWGDASYTDLSEIQSQTAQETHGSFTIGEYIEDSTPDSPPISPSNLKVIGTE